MKDKIKIAFAVSLGLLVFSALSYAKEPVYIGLSAPMSGAYAEIGASFKKGIELAIEQISKSGGIDGINIELIVGDSKGEQEASKLIADTFVRNGEVAAVIGDFTSACSLRAQSVYRKAKMVQLSPTASHPSFAPGSPYSFGIVGTQTEEAPFIADTAVRILGKKRLTVLYVNDEWGIAVKDRFVERGKQLSAEVVGVEAFFKGTKDFAPLLKKIRATKPDFLCLATLVNDAALICKERQKLGWDDVTIMGPLSLYTPELITLGGDAAEDLYTFTFFYPKDPSPTVRQFVKSHESAYNQTPTWFAAVAHDAMNLLAEAMKKAGTERSAIRDALAGIRDFPGVTGNITFKENRTITREYLLLQVKNKDFVLYFQK